MKDIDHHMGNQPHDVMISYKTEDREVAYKMRDHLEKAGIRCWIAPASVQPGENYEVAIGNAIKRCAAVVLVFSGVTEQSKDVKQEMSLAFKLGKPIIPFRIAHVEPDDLVYVLANKHWLDAVPPGPAHYLKLEERLKSILDEPPSDAGRRRPKVTYRDRLRGVPRWVCIAFIAALSLILGYFKIVPAVINKSLSKGWGMKSLNQVYATACAYQNAWYLRDKSIPTYWRVMAYQTKNFDEWRKKTNAVRIEELRLEYQEALQRGDKGRKQDDLVYQWAHFLRLTGHADEALAAFQELQQKFPDTNWKEGTCYYLAALFREAGDQESFLKQKTRLMSYPMNGEVFDFERGFLITVREAILKLSSTNALDSPPGTPTGSLVK